jgi:predicted DCC family thiol-disulfide oxidoreductase YuxK
MINFRRYFDKKIDGTGLAIFRIVYNVVLLCEIVQLYYFRHLIFDKIPYLSPAEIDFSVPIIIWAFSVIALILGVFTRFFSILNYILSLILIGTIHTFEYHVFYSYIGINFIMIFMPISKCLSVDRLIEKLKYSNTTYRHNPTNLVRQIHYFIIPFVGLGLVYLDSVFYKIASPMWLGGLGSWLPSSLPMITHSQDTFLLNQEWLVRSIGIGTIIFETVFIFLFFRKKWRVTMLVLGILLHLGIVIEFPIPWFGLTACAVYLLLVPVSFWKKFIPNRKAKSTLTFFYDKDCPLCIRTVIFINHFNWLNKISFKTVQYDAIESSQLNLIPMDTLLADIHSVNSKGFVFNGVDTYIQVFRRTIIFFPLYLILKIPGIYNLSKLAYNYIAKNRNTERCTEDNCGYIAPQLTDTNQIKILQNVKLEDLKLLSIKFFLIIVCVLQFSFITDTLLIEKSIKYFNLQNSSYINSYNDFSKKLGKITTRYLGIAKHPVFMDDIHFNNYNHIIAITYVNENGTEIWLPIINEKGMPDFYIYGANWIKWTFRVNSPEISTTNLNLGIRDFTAFWAEHNNINLKLPGKYQFNIKVKKIDIPNSWEKDHLNNQIAKPWIDGGYIIWENSEFTNYIKEIEKL